MVNRHIEVARAGALHTSYSEQLQTSISDESKQLSMSRALGREWLL
jgi:hypothetical protein